MKDRLKYISSQLDNEKEVIKKLYGLDAKSHLLEKDNLFVLNVFCEDTFTYWADDSSMSIDIILKTELNNFILLKGIMTIKELLDLDGVDYSELRILN